MIFSAATVAFQRTGRLSEVEMCAQVVKFRPWKEASDASGEPEDQAGAAREMQRDDCRADTTVQQFWTGASGNRYIHSIYSLLYCPELPAVNYLLVHRDPQGTQKVLAAGHTKHDAPSLNLAEVRKLGATLGANEVHVHRLADDATAAKVVEHDLRQAQLASTLPVVSGQAH